jgi:hypothetical protein
MSSTLIRFKYHDAIFPEPALSCHTLKYVNGPNGSSTLIIKFMTLPEVKHYELKKKKKNVYLLPHRDEIVIKR